MDGLDREASESDRLIALAAQVLTGHKRRRFVAEVTLSLCGGSTRLSEERFGWSRKTARKGISERASGIRCLDDFAARRRPAWEERHPQIAADVRAIVEPKTQADPELKSSRRYTNVSAKEVCAALLAKGHDPQDVPAERTMRDVLNRMNYRLKRIQKGKPLKKTEDTDAIFANVAAVKAEIAAEAKVRAKARGEPETLEISVDTKAKVALGDYSRGGKNQDEFGGGNAEGVGS